MRKHLGSVATLGVAVLVSGCGGGGQSSAPAIPSTGLIKTAPVHGTAKARLTVKIPLRKASATNSSRRTPRYVSPGTKELAIRAAASADIGTAPWQFFDVSAGASACTTAGGFQTCTVSITAPLPAVPGTEDEVQIIATDVAPQPGDTLPNGDYLSTGDTSVTVTVGAVNPVNALLTGVIGSLAIAPSPSKTAYSVWAAPGSSSTVMVPITPFDFAGGEIAGNAYSFNNPITFSDGLGTASPFTYQSANPSATPPNYGLPPSLTPGVPISAPVVYLAPQTLTAPSTTTVTVSTVVPNYLPSPAPPKVWPVTTFTLSPMVVSVAGMPVASIPNLVVGGPDVTVTVNEDKALVSQVANNTGGAVSLGPIQPTLGATTFTVHALSATSDPTSTIVVTDANGTAATLPVMVAATASPTPTPTSTPTATPTPSPTSTPTVAPTGPPMANVTITSSSVLRQVTKRH